jgi:hypothetical protein
VKSPPKGWIAEPAPFVSMGPCSRLSTDLFQNQLYAATCTDTNSGLHREVWREFTASSAMNLPITSAFLRLVVMRMGVGSTRWTYAGALVPPRFTFTTNLVFVICLVSTFLREDKATVHFPTVEYTTPVRGLPHSTQHAFNRDVIRPQDGHILCVPYRAIRGLRSRVLRSTRIANNAISKPTSILVAFINDPSWNVQMTSGRAFAHKCLEGDE